MDGPLFLAQDTHALSEPAFATALEVMAANDVRVLVDQDLGYTPTPALSHAILTYNRDRKTGLADGIVITPSHNPPEDGGFKYNPPNGGPADTTTTGWIENRANEILASGMKDVRRSPYRTALDRCGRYDYISNYVNDLGSVVDLDAVRGTRFAFAADALGGAGWPTGRGSRSGTDSADDRTRPSGPHLPFHVARLGRQDSDGLLVALCDGGADRHEGPFRCGVGLRHGSRPPRHRDAERGAAESEPLSGGGDFVSLSQPAGWRAEAGVGKTMVSSSMIDRVAASLGRT